jgi:hypothetical protein
MTKNSTRLVLVLVIVGRKGPLTHSQNAVASTTGKAIASRLNRFLSVTFPAASSTVTLVQKWFSKTLDDKQQKQVTAAATQIQAEVNTPLATAKASIQAPANTLTLTSAVLYRTNKASANTRLFPCSPGRLCSPTPFAQWSLGIAQCIQGRDSLGAIQMVRKASSEPARAEQVVPHSYQPATV